MTANISNVLTNNNEQITPMCNNHPEHEHPTSFAELSARDKRAVLFHILYAAESYDYQASIESIVDNLNRGFELDIPLDDPIVIIAANIIELRDNLDDTYKPFLTNWRFDRIGVPTKLILRYAVWELLHTTIPTTIIINEAIELAKAFGEKDSYKFINGVLDELVKKLPARQQKEGPDNP
ncbi:MAG: transcription antitermination factor NusB [Candidatus Babeliales bacterium]